MKIGLIKENKTIKTEVYDYIYNDITDETDFNNLYEIALEKLINYKKNKINIFLPSELKKEMVVLSYVIKICIENDVELSIWHYDNLINEYYEQKINEPHTCIFCGKSKSIEDLECQNCGM